MNYDDIDPDTINSIDEITDYLNLKISEYNYIFSKKNNNNKKRLDELSELHEKIKKRRNYLRKEERKAQREKEKEIEQEKENKRLKRDEELLEKIRVEKDFKEKRCGEINNELSLLQQELNEKNDLINKYRKELEMDKLEKNISILEKELKDVKKKSVCPHPYQCDFANKYKFNGECHTWIESYGFDREYGHCCPLCNEKFKH